MPTSAITDGEQRVLDALQSADAHPDFTPEQIHELVRQSQGHVIYFMQAGPSGPIKIGTTRADRLQARRDQLQIANPYPIEVLGTSPGDNRLERRIHMLFGHLRMHGEWYWPHPDLVAVATGRRDVFDTTHAQWQNQS